jgi:hypothetical protein
MVGAAKVAAHPEETTMLKLNDTQTILLSHASRVETGSFYPLPDKQAAAGPRVTKALARLLSAGLAEERETSDVSAVYRTDGDLRYGLFATPAGLAAIGVGESTASAASAPSSPAAPAPRINKTALVLELLERNGGASLPELIAATGWLPHTTRAALTGLRKKGHAVIRSKRGEVTCYAISKAA